MNTIDPPSATPQTSSVWKDPLFWFVMALGFGYGVVFNFLPVTFPVFKREFGATLEQMGQSQFLFSISSLVFSVIGGWMIARLGLKRAAIAGLFLAGGALLAIGDARSFLLVLLGAFFFGLAIFALVVIGSSIISGHFAEKRQSIFLLSGLSDAGGAMVGPAALGWWFVHADRSGGSWRTGYYLSAGGLGVLLIWAILIRSDRMPQEGSDTKTGAAAFATMGKVLRSPLIYMVSLLGFFHGLAQSGMLSFIGQLYQRRLGVNAAQAAYFISVNMGGCLAGRLLFGWITARWKIPELCVLAACAAAETLAFVATIVAPNYWVGIGMYTIAGIFISANGPSLNSYLGMRFAGRTATAFALFAGLGNIGAALGSYLTGVVGNRLNLEIGIWSGPVFSAVLSALALIWFLRERTQEKLSTC